MFLRWFLKSASEITGLHPSTNTFSTGIIFPTIDLYFSGSFLLLLLFCLRQVSPNYGAFDSLAGSIHMSFKRLYDLSDLSLGLVCFNVCFAIFPFHSYQIPRCFLSKPRSLYWTSFSHLSWIALLHLSAYHGNRLQCLTISFVTILIF
jgi:hypothetical protein